MSNAGSIGIGKLFGIAATSPTSSTESIPNSHTTKVITIRARTPAILLVGVKTVIPIMRTTVVVPTTAEPGSHWPILASQSTGFSNLFEPEGA